MSFINFWLCLFTQKIINVFSHLYLYSITVTICFHLIWCARLVENFKYLNLTVVSRKYRNARVIIIMVESVSLKIIILPFQRSAENCVLYPYRHRAWSPFSWLHNRKFRRIQKKFNVIIKFRHIICWEQIFHLWVEIFFAHRSRNAKITQTLEKKYHNTGLRS